MIYSCSLLMLAKLWYSVRLKRLTTRVEELETAEDQLYAWRNVHTKTSAALLDGLRDTDKQHAALTDVVSKLQSVVDEHKKLALVREQALQNEIEFLRDGLKQESVRFDHKLSEVEKKAEQKPTFTPVFLPRVFH